MVLQSSHPFIKIRVLFEALKLYFTTLREFPVPEVFGFLTQLNPFQTHRSLLTFCRGFFFTLALKHFLRHEFSTRIMRPDFDSTQFISNALSSKLPRKRSINICYVILQRR